MEKILNKIRENFFRNVKTLEIDEEVYSRGEHIATIINLDSPKIESIIKFVSKKSKQKVDWHYVGGRAAVKAIGDLNRVKYYLEKKLRKEDPKNYRFTTENDSVLPYLS